MSELYENTVITNFCYKYLFNSKTILQDFLGKVCHTPLSNMACVVVSFVFLAQKRFTVKRRTEALVDEVLLESYHYQHRQMYSIGSSYTNTSDLHPAELLDFACDHKSPKSESTQHLIFGVQ